MASIELIVALVLVAAMLAGLARAVRIHYAIVLVLGGLVLGFVPASTPAIAPNVIFLVFLPPLTYAAAFQSSNRDLRANARPIGFLAVGLVLVTMTGVAVVAHGLAGIGWGSAIVLGAILAPTDPVAATSVLRAAGAPDRISTILEGEALVNDGTGLTVYKLAVTAVLSGGFALGSGLLRFLLALAGVGIGLVAGWVSAEIRARIDEAPMEVTVSLLTAYLAYIPADRLGSSGILAAVAAGLYTRRRAGDILSPQSRLQTVSFWEVATFLLESVLFLLIGLQMKHIVSTIHGGIGLPVLYGLAVAATLVVLRTAWMFVEPSVLRLIGGRFGAEPATVNHREQLVLAWSGMRGAVSLAAALAVPLTARGRPFPDRALMIFIAYAAIVVTLVVPGLTIGRMVRALGIGEEALAAREEARVRLLLAHAALGRVEDAAEDEELPEEAIAQLRAIYESRVDRLKPHASPHHDPDERHDVAIRLARLRRELIGVERARLHALRRRGEISAAGVRRIEHELDLEESRLRLGASGGGSGDG
jgi:Na+/H+ antiporter